MKFISFLLLSLIPAVLCISNGDYGKTFSGDGTYYGGTDNGNCAIRRPIPGMYAGMIGVAINNAQYGLSDACGACVEIRGNGQGAGANPIIGPIRGYVMDRCPECGYGAVDLGIPGDGRWKVSWKFVDCPGEKPWFLFEGSNSNYWKLQPRGMRRPAKSVVANGRVGYRTQDNFYEIHGSFNMPVTVTITTIDGAVITAKLNYFKGSGPVYPASSGGGGPGRPAPRPVPRQPNRGCANNWQACASSNCCKSRAYACKRSWDRDIRFKRCEPRKADMSCVPKYKACTGPYNWWRTSRCCGGYVCKRSSQRNFVGNRCEPA